MSYLEMNGKMNFLIIDCDLSNASVIKIHLKKMGYQNVTLLAGGFEAINYMRSNAVDFVISRLKLPNMTGTELLAELQNDFKIPRKPFLLFDEDLDAGDLALIKEFGADGFLSLPFVTKDLAEKVMKTWHKYINPKDPEFYYEQSRKFVLQDAFAEATKIFKALIQSKMLIARSTLGLAKIALHEGRNEDARKIATMICESHPNYIHGFQFLGEVELACNEPAKAVAHFCKAIELSPKNPYRYQIVSELLAQMKLWEPNVTILKQAESQSLEYNFVEEGLARSFMNLKLVEEAIRYYEILVKRNPKDSAALNNISVCYKKLNETNRSIEYGLKALALDESNVKILFNLSLSYIAKQKSNEAIKYLKKIVSLDPHFDKAKLKLLELTDTTAFKAELAKHSKLKIVGERHEEKDQESIYSASPLNSVITNSILDAKESDIDHEGLNLVIKNIAKRVKDRDEGKIPPLILAGDEKDRICKLTNDAVNQSYFNAVLRTREQFEILMELWLGSVVDISQELVQQIGEVADGALSTNEISIKKVFEFVSSSDKESHEMFNTLRGVMTGHKKLKNTLMPILDELQFQDYFSQSVKSLEACYKISMTDRNTASAHKKMLECFVSESDRNRFRQIVLGEVIDEKDIVPEGSVIPFD